MNELKKIRWYVWLLALVGGAGLALAVMKLPGVIAAFVEVWRQTHS
jgi:hypothetical protein